MTTLITQGGNEGSRRCDGRCHFAKAPDCDCVCGGALHGKGLEAQQVLNDALPLARALTAGNVRVTAQGVLPVAPLRTGV